MASNCSCVGTRRTGFWGFFHCDELVQELAQRGLFGLHINSIQLRQPNLESSFGDLPVTGSKTVFFALASRLLDSVVCAAVAMTIETRIIRNLVEKLPGTEAIALHVRTLGGDSRGVSSGSDSCKERD